MRFLLYKWKVFNQEDIKAALERAGHEVHVFNAVDFVREKQGDVTVSGMVTFVTEACKKALSPIRVKPFEIRISEILSRVALFFFKYSCHGAPPTA